MPGYSSNLSQSTWPVSQGAEQRGNDDILTRHATFIAERNLPVVPRTRECQRHLPIETLKSPINLEAR
jgi:hypothetical protein